MSGLFLMSLLLLPRATFNCILCKVWDASLFTSASFPMYFCPQMVCIKLLSVSPGTLKVAGPWGWTHSKSAMPPKHFGLGFVYLCIYLYPMWRIWISGHNSRVQKKVTFLYSSKSNLKDAMLLLAELAENSALVLRILPQPILRTKTASRFVSGPELRKSSLVWGPYWSCLNPCVLWAQTHSDAPVRAKNSGWEHQPCLRFLHTPEAVWKKVPSSGYLLEADLFSTFRSSSDLLPSQLDFLSLQVSVALSPLCPALLYAFAHANW